MSNSPNTPVWWLVCKRELVELWLGGRVLVLLILFSALMSVTAVMQQIESGVSTIPPAELVFILAQAVITFGLLIGLIVGADSISGERERGTLETLLLAPSSRRQIVTGKFLAAMSPWPAAFVISIPYLVVLAQGDDVLLPALGLTALAGTLLALAFAALGVLVSIWSNSNRVSLFASLLIYVLFLIPTMWSGFAQKGDLGYLIQKLNPMQGASAFLEKVLVNNRTVEEVMSYFLATILSAIVVPAVLFLFAAPRLRLEGSAPRLRLRAQRAAAGGLFFVVVLAAALGWVLPLRAATPTAEEPPLQIAVDLDHKTISAGQKIAFNSIVTNNGTESSPPMHVSMNIINMGSGEPVDPEDWSPERSQIVERLAPGESAEQSWTVHGILEGNYMVYVTVIPTPSGPDTTSQTTSSTGIHLIVGAFADARNPGGVVPVAIAIPTVLIVVALLIRRRWRPAAVPVTSDAAV
jgi:ABC-type transport system involved in cytochrome c biogenesis permease component